MKPRRSQRSREVQRQFVVPAGHSPRTLAACLPLFLRELSADSAQLAVAVGCVFVDGRRVDDPAFELVPGQLVTANLGRPYELAVLARGATTRIVPQHRVLHEDEHLVVVFKPAGLLTAPTPEGRGHDLSSLLTTEQRQPLIVHRLDRDTSGVLVFAKTREANRALAELFRTHDLLRRYDAFVGAGYPNDTETLEAPIDGRRAVTKLRVAERRTHCTRLEVTLETGRTHQIRLHLSGRGFPVLGDLKYGRRAAADPPRLALHARVLELAHPLSAETLRFDVELPEDLANWWASQS